MSDTQLAPKRGLLRAIGAALGPIAIVYGYRTLVGALLVSPIERPLREELARSPGGDRTLLEGGGALLVEALWRAIPSVRASAKTIPIVALVASLIALVPLAALLHALAADGGARLKACFAAALRRFPAFVLLLGCASIGEALAAVFMLQAVAIPGDPSSSPRAAAIALGVGLVAVIPLLAISVLHDAARVAVVARGLGFYDASARAFRVLRRRPWALLSAFMIATLATLLLASVTLAAPLWIGMGGSGRWILVTLVQQVAVVGMVVVRTGYFARLMAVDREA